MGKSTQYYSEQEKYYVGELTSYYAKILMILKKCNLSDLRTIFETLAEMGFKEES